MAPSAWEAYESAKRGIGSGLINLWSDTFALMLLKSSYKPNWDDDAFWSDVSSHELPTGGGYTAGGVVLGSVQSEHPVFKRVSPSWEMFTAGPFRYGVIVHRAQRSLASHDLLLCCSDLGSDITGLGKRMTIEFADSGIFELL